jgi:protein-S-isoprenylcysteine O-methyltransferase Ste14
MNISNNPADNSGVRIHPPFFFLGALLVSSGLERMWPWPIFGHQAPRVVGGVIAFFGIALIAWGRGVMVARGTNLNPTLPTTAIVTTGPFRFSRNPLYLGLTMTYLGLAMAINAWWSFLLLVPVLFAMHFDVVLREERYLEQKFGDNYRQYCARVRRYL